MRSRHLWLLVLAAICLGGYVYGKGAVTLETFLSDFGSNLAAGFIGAFLTVALIDRGIERERLRDSLRLKKLASRRLAPSVVEHVLDFLWHMYVATARARPEHFPKTVAQMFGDDFFASVRTLDFSRDARTSPPGDWFGWAATSLKRFQARIREVMDLYGSSLPVDLVELLETLSDSNFSRTMLRRLRDHEVGDDARLDLLADAEVIDSMRTYCERVAKMVDALGEDHAFRFDYRHSRLLESSKFGDARIDASIPADVDD